MILTHGFTLLAVTASSTSFASSYANDGTDEFTAQLSLLSLIQIRPKTLDCYCEVASEGIVGIVGTVGTMGTVGTVSTVGSGGLRRSLRARPLWGSAQRLTGQT